MDRAGFEVGVHGLEHDGKLYNSKVKFGEKAAGIRDYLRKWSGCGFRSPLMQHRLGWLHALGVEYDASTFDTDPFEPEPDGARTIFPFWVPGPSGDGYVELPYSLPQDHGLFAVLQEPNIEIWKKKLDWVAEHGGMALLNTHPDYMSFSEGKQTGEKREKDAFPASWYGELLAYVREKYEGLYWSALPRDVARYYVANVPAESRNSRKKICMLAYTGYETDNRVRRYAEELARRGDYVDVIALNTRDSLPAEEVINGVNLFRVQNRNYDERRKWTFAWRLLRFLIVSSIFLRRRHQRIRYDLVHVHNVPDFLVFAAWYPKLTGAKLILDIHDLVPELFASKFTSRAGSLYMRLLKAIEKLSAKFVDHVIVSNHLWQKTLISRSVPEQKCSVFLNNVDLELFHPHLRTRNDEKIVVLFPGSFQWHQGLDIAIEAFARIKKRLPNAEFHLYGGGGGTEPALTELAGRLGVGESVKFMGSAPMEQIPDLIANADLGVVPKRADSFGNEAYSTKIMEFMSQGLPVVASRTKIDSYYFDEDTVRFFPSGDVEAMANAMMEVIENKVIRESLVKRGFEYVSRNNWNTRKNDYLAIVDSLTTEEIPVPGRIVAAAPFEKHSQA